MLTESVALDFPTVTLISISRGPAFGTAACPSIVSPFKSGIFTILNKLRITRLLPLLMPVIHLFTDSLIYILTKEQ